MLKFQTFQEQAGTELGQAQLKLRLNYTLIICIFGWGLPSLEVSHFYYPGWVGGGRNNQT